MSGFCIVCTLMFRIRSLFSFLRGLRRVNYMAKRKGFRIDILERNFQKNLIQDIKKRFKGCIVCKLDAQYIQGIPDLLILYGPRWATLEVKRSQHASRRPNQKYYVELMNKMSFSRFISPENKEIVLDELEKIFNKKL